MPLRHRQSSVSESGSSRRVCPARQVYCCRFFAYHGDVNILAIDTSTEACSAALLRADGEIFGELEVAPRQHTRLLPAMMERVLEAAAVSRNALTHCAFANGPGAFTGIRIAAAQAQGIGIALDIPLLPVSTLAVLAQTGIDRLGCCKPLTALDARMQEIYWAVYRQDEQGLASLVGSERLSPPERIEFDETVDCGLGHGWVESLSRTADFAIEAEMLPDARSMLKLAAAAARERRGVAASVAGINYLRNRVAEKAAS
ncbi:MAG: tRNA (adenosine(37)-N6)-threonylcarbamoyltransferase complex dimerization subunit type 1 TsaB [Gammaproteobacteria bacterium]|nr:MAG: tRNA (adenosine(37)-N6)-threonylcarbamoyltransferase complex dimerization subunit type 1 TsaB [Gammaproteobacteria bacterium]